MTQEEVSPIQIGARLKWLRIHIGVSQRKFAASIDVQPPQYNNWEKGRFIPSLPAALRINEVYGTSLDFIYLGRIDTLPSHLANAWLSSERANTSTASND